MSDIQTADVNTSQPSGTVGGEGSSATPANPNTLEPSAPSSVEPQVSPPSDAQPEPQGVATAQPAGQEPAAPESDDAPPQLPANVKQQTKQRFDELLAQKKRLEEIVATMGGGGMPQPFSMPSQPGTPSQPVVPSNAQPPPAAMPSQDDPWQKEIDRRNEEYSRAAEAFNALEPNDPQRNRYAADAKRAFDEAKRLERQQTVVQTAQFVQQQQVMAARTQQAFREVADVNESLNPEIRFIDTQTGMARPDSLAFQAMASLARVKFSYTPQQLMADPMVLEFCAKDVAWRLNHAATSGVSITRQQVAAQQKRMAQRVGLESGGEPAAPVLTGNAAERKNLEAIARNPKAPEDARRQANLRLMALSLARK